MCWSLPLLSPVPWLMAPDLSISAPAAYLRACPKGSPPLLEVFPELLSSDRLLAVGKAVCYRGWHTPRLGGTRQLPSGVLPLGLPGSAWSFTSQMWSLPKFSVLCECWGPQARLPLASRDLGWFGGLTLSSESWVVWVLLCFVFSLCYLHI